MKKSLALILAAMMVLTVCVSACAISNASKEHKYMSISELRSTMPLRWIGQYTTSVGESVPIDIPIVIPNVNAVPIVRIGWNGPVEGFNDDLDIRDNERNGFLLVHGAPEDGLSENTLENDVVVSGNITLQNASDVLINLIKKYVPSMVEFSFECGYIQAFGDKPENSSFRMKLYPTYHGIPYLVHGSYGSIVENEPSVPANFVDAEVFDTDRFYANVYAPKELSVDIMDVPLLSFDEILSIFEKRIIDGYVYSLNEVHFGYMVFVDPQNKDEEYLLCPVWAAKGVTRGDVSIPWGEFTDDTILDFTGYSSGTIVVINAQTGEVYDFTHDRRTNRRDVYTIITWDDVQ